jgi:ABC-type dipeptide/oligopeptide/nickel transport system permease component
MWTIIVGVVAFLVGGLVGLWLGIGSATVRHQRPSFPER